MVSKCRKHLADTSFDPPLEDFGVDALTSKLCFSVCLCLTILFMLMMAILAKCNWMLS